MKNDREHSSGQNSVGEKLGSWKEHKEEGGE